jgi:hypothetical protein
MAIPISCLGRYRAFSSFCPENNKNSFSSKQLYRPWHFSRKIGQYVSMRNRTSSFAVQFFTVMHGDAKFAEDAAIFRCITKRFGVNQVKIVPKT